MWVPRPSRVPLFPFFLFFIGQGLLRPTARPRPPRPIPGHFLTTDHCSIIAPCGAPPPPPPLSGASLARTCRLVAAQSLDAMPSQPRKGPWHSIPLVVFACPISWVASGNCLPPSFFDNIGADRVFVCLFDKLLTSPSSISDVPLSPGQPTIVSI